MKQFILTLVFLLALAGSAFAVPTSLQVPATQDTFVVKSFLLGTLTIGSCGTMGFNTTFNYGNCSAMLISLASGDIASILQYNSTSIQNKVITSLKLVSPTSTAGAPHTRPLIYNSNNTWNETNITGDIYNNNNFAGTGTTLLQSILLGGGSATSTDFIDLTNGSAQVLGDIYSKGIVTLQVAFPAGCTGSCSTSVFWGTHEGTATYLDASLDDATTAEIFSTGNVNTYFDFESNHVSSSSFTGADFQYNVHTNTLTPIAPAQLVGADSTPTNTLLTTNCGSGFTMSQFLNTNVPAGTFSKYCFDLSSQHNGQAYRGLIKVVNNTDSGSIFNFDWALFDPSFTTFSNIAISPSPAVEGLNLTVTWQTTNAITSVLRYRYFDTNTLTWTAFGGITNDTLATQHSLTIPSTSMFETEYEIDLSGLDVSNNSFVATPFMFNATSSLATLAVQGLGVFTFNEYGFPTPAGISLDGGLAQTTTQFQNINGQTVYGVSFDKSIVSLGNHNITAKDYASSTRTGATVVSVTSYPTFVSLTLRPHSSCVPASFHAQMDFCNQTMSTVNFSSIGATGKFCKYNPDECNLYNFTDGSCIKTAGQRTPPIPYVLYVCFDDYNPTGHLISPDGNLGYVVPLGQSITGQTGAGIAGATEPLGQWLGTDAEGAKFFIAMIVTLIITIIVGIFSKNGVVAGITFLGLLAMFTFVGWLPWWLFLIMAVLTTFLIARFFRESLTPA